MSTIVTNIERLDTATIAKFSNIPPSDFGHRLNFNLISSRKIKPVSTIKKQFAGSAITVRIPPNDSILVYKAIELAQLGDVIIVDMNGEDRYACWGEITTRVAQEKGVVAAIINGPATDSLCIEQLDFPVYSTATSPLTTKLYSLDGDINLPIAIDDVVVHPGDIVIGDNDGLMIVPKDNARKYVLIGDEELQADVSRKEKLESIGAEKYLQQLQEHVDKLHVDYK